jgi:NADPH-dependent curcumin reductase CurA
MIGSYNDPEPPRLRFLMRVIAARIPIQGFLIIDYMQRMPEFYAGMTPLIASGAVTSRETVMDGLEAMPQAFLGLFEGANTGKMLVRL